MIVYCECGQWIDVSKSDFKAGTYPKLCPKCVKKMQKAEKKVKKGELQNIGKESEENEFSDDMIEEKKDKWGFRK